MSHCQSCQSYMIRKHVFEHAPIILAFDMSQHRTLLLPSIVLNTVDGHHTAYKLRGVVYHLHDHFTSCFITETGTVWYHDGMSTGQQMEQEGNYVNMINFQTCWSHLATCAIYIIPSQNSDLVC
ncbi:hypothetical protein L208DRAFT_1330708 [Tricholoma matsutake]|nr:hypothetical protein L208DRAFT_1330708 [Tricholoma matsutake 945]